MSFILDDGPGRRVTWGYVDSLMPFSDADACDLDRCLHLPSPVYLMKSAHSQLPYRTFCCCCRNVYRTRITARTIHTHTWLTRHHSKDQRIPLRTTNNLNLTSPRLSLHITYPRFSLKDGVYLRSELRYCRKEAQGRQHHEKG